MTEKLQKSSDLITSKTIFCTKCMGVDIDLWLFLGRGEYNKRAVEVCICLLRLYKQENKITDRQSCFYQYIQELKQQGYEIEI